MTAGGKNVPPANIEIRFRDDPFILARGRLRRRQALPDRRHVAQRGRRPRPPRRAGHRPGGRRAEAVRELVQRSRRQGERRAGELRDHQEVRHHRDRRSPSPTACSPPRSRSAARRSTSTSATSSRRSTELAGFRRAHLSSPHSSRTGAPRRAPKGIGTCSSRTSRSSSPAPPRAWARTSPPGSPRPAPGRRRRRQRGRARATLPAGVHTRRLDVSNETDVVDSSAGPTRRWAGSTGSSTTPASSATGSS